MTRIGRFKSAEAVAADKAVQAEYYKKPKRCVICGKVISYLSWVRYNAENCSRPCINESLRKKREKREKLRAHMSRIRRLNTPAQIRSARENISKGRTIKLAKKILRERARNTGEDGVGDVAHQPRRVA